MIELFFFFFFFFFFFSSFPNGYFSPPFSPGLAWGYFSKNPVSVGLPVGVLFLFFFFFFIKKLSRLPPPFFSLPFGRANNPFLIVLDSGRHSPFPPCLQKLHSACAQRDALPFPRWPNREPAPFSPPFFSQLNQGFLPLLAGARLSCRVEKSSFPPPPSFPWCSKSNIFSFFLPPLFFL